VAQWAIESAWGARTPGNNCFGIKFAPSRHARSQQLVTAEVVARSKAEPGDCIDQEIAGGRVRVRGARSFAAYDSLEDCFEDHARLIVDGAPYREAWKRYRENRDFDQFVRAISPVYATEPMYSATVLNIARLPELINAIAEARRAPGGTPPNR
jgi:flagellum-specific peptidoglycan hydrolase FlgJ